MAGNSQQTTFRTKEHALPVKGTQRHHQAVRSLQRFPHGLPYRTPALPQARPSLTPLSPHRLAVPITVADAAPPYHDLRPSHCLRQHSKTHENQREYVLPATHTGRAAVMDIAAAHSVYDGLYSHPSRSPCAKRPQLTFRRNTNIERRLGFSRPFHFLLIYNHIFVNLRITKDE